MPPTDESSSGGRIPQATRKSRLAPRENHSRVLNHSAYSFAESGSFCRVRAEMQLLVAHEERSFQMALWV